MKKRKLKRWVKDLIIIIFLFLIALFVVNELCKSAERYNKYMEEVSINESR